MTAREFSRLDRLSSTIRKTLAEPVNELARAHGAGLASITAVEVSPDLRHGTVYLSVYGDAGRREEFVAYVGERAAMLQGVLARALRTRRVPVLSFRQDDTLENAERIRGLLQGAPGADTDA